MAVFGLLICLVKLAVDTASGQEKQDIHDHEEVLSDTTNYAGKNYMYVV